MQGCHGLDVSHVSLHSVGSCPKSEHVTDGEQRCYQRPAGEADAADRKSTRLNSSHVRTSRMPSSA